jgi:single-strand DNA-binding protein
MASFNRVILVGNVTRDLEVRYLQSGTAVVELGMAVSRQWTDKSSNERKEETTFVDVTLWGRTAEIAGEYLSKGRPVLIEGRLQLDQWDDRETGKKRSKLKVVGEHLQLLGSRSDGGGGGRPSGGTSSQQPHFSENARQDTQPAGRDQAESFYDSPPPPSPPDDDVPF